MGILSGGGDGFAGGGGGGYDDGISCRKSALRETCLSVSSCSLLSFTYHPNILSFLEDQIIPSGKGKDQKRKIEGNREGTKDKGGEKQLVDTTLNIHIIWEFVLSGQQG